MSKVDIMRVVERIPELFAPAIYDGQGFVAYLDEETNIFTVQGDNLFTSTSHEEIERFSASVASLAAQINNIQDDCSDIPSIKTQIQSLQSDVAALQSDSSGSSSGGSSSSMSIITVDDIVYGAYDSNPSPDNAKTLRGRGYINNTGYGEIYWSSGCIRSTADKVYAGFADGKIHTNVEYGEDISSTPIDNGALIFCKSDNSLYQYDAENQKFIQLGGKRHYVVNRIVDAVTSVEINNPLPSEVNSVGKVFVNLKYGLYLCYVTSTTRNYPYNVMEIETLDEGFRFANIQSILSDDAGIYQVFNDSYGDKGIRVIHDIQDGDSIYCKADSCTYFFTDNGTAKSFVKNHSPVIAPVLAICPVGTNLPSYPNAGDKYLEYDGGNYSGGFYTSVTGGSWDNYKAVQKGDRYASSTDFKIYEFKEQYEVIFPIDIPVGIPFLNKADNSLYVFDGTQIVKT